MIISKVATKDVPITVRSFLPFLPADGRAIIKQAYRESKKNGEIYKVSEYGAKDVHEFFAECFAMYIAEEEQLPPTIAKMFKELKL